METKPSPAPDRELSGGGVPAAACGACRVLAFGGVLAVGEARGPAESAGAEEAGWRTSLAPGREPAAAAAAAAPCPVGRLGIVPVADCLAEPVEIGGELGLISTSELRPKQTLSLALGMVSPMTEPPDVVPSLDIGIEDKSRLGWVNSFSVGLKLLPSSAEVRMVSPSRPEAKEGEG